MFMRESESARSDFSKQEDFLMSQVVAYTVDVIIFRNISVQNGARWSRCYYRTIIGSGMWHII